MAIKQLLYVHGAGRQPAASTMKAQIDKLLFGGPQATSRMGYYANVRWGSAGGGGIAAAPGGSGKARRAAAVRIASDPTLSPKAAAEAVTTAALARRRTTGVGVAPAAARKEAADLTRQLYERADRVARRTSARAGLGIGFPDPIFRIVVGFFASDVIDYLYGGFKAAMRAPVEQALRQGPVPDVIVAHSLGTIITYDLLADPALAARRPKVLVTVGCPLGIDNVQVRLRNGAGVPNPIPSGIQSWANFGDRFDPVALEATLRDEFRPPKDFIVDDEVNNQAKNNHDLDGYLKIGVVRSAIRSAAGVP